MNGRNHLNETRTCCKKEIISKRDGIQKFVVRKNCNGFEIFSSRKFFSSCLHQGYFLRSKLKKNIFKLQLNAVAN